jgi:general secretion pathway protein G
LLAAVVATNVIGRIDKARVQTTKVSLKMLDSAVKQFKLDTGVYPSEEMGLEELVNPPAELAGVDLSGYLDTTEVPRDAWGYEFIYEMYPDSGKAFVIISLGADGEDSGEGYDADLYSTDAD